MCEAVDYTDSQLGVRLVPMVTALLLITVPGHHIGSPCLRTNQKFRHKFSIFECMKIAQNYAQVFLPLSYTIQYSTKCYFFAGRHFFIRKMKIKMADCKKHVLSKVVKNIIFHNKTLLVMFYRHNKTFWYQFCNFKHFLKAENSEDSLASSCVEFSIGLSCNPVWDWVTIGTRVRLVGSTCG